MRFVPGFVREQVDTSAHYIVLTEDAQVLGHLDVTWRPLTAADIKTHGFTVIEQHHIGSFEGKACYAVKVETAAIPSHLGFEPLRNLLVSGRIQDDEFAMIGAGLQVFNWDKAHRFCGQCGQPTEYHPRDRARVCEACRLHVYPRISPCVIGLITKGDHCLLAKHAMSRGNFYSPLAGFIEPGESAENALHREVAEEVAIKIRNLRYFASQPWPYPGQLMLGFHAEYDSGDIVVDQQEIIDAQWYHFQDLPSVPSVGSLSGRLIQHFVELHSQ